MKEKILILFLLFISIDLFAQKFEEPFDFYVYDMSEAAGLFQYTTKYIEAMENGTISEPNHVNQLINAAYIRDIENFEMTCLFLQAYFRETKNKNIQSIVSKSFNKEISNIQSDVINKQFKSTLLVNSSEESHQYVYDNKLYSEDIKFSQLTTIQSTDGILNAFIPTTQWNPFSFSGNKSKTTFISNGQTESISVSLSEEIYDKLPEVDNKSLVYNISNYGVNKDNNSDVTILEIKENKDNFFIFELSLYLERTKTVYTINYKYNISTININYPIFEDLKKLLLYYSFLTYLEI